MITLDQTSTLQLIDASGSFRAAARLLKKAPSAVSYDVRKMEEELGIQIFNRQGYRAVLTSEGKAILAEGRLMLAHSARMEVLAQGFRSDWEPQLEIVIDAALPIEPVMQALKTLVDEGAPTRVHARVEFLRGKQGRFESDEVNTMLVKDYHHNQKLTALPLPRIESVLVAASSHPLIARSGKEKWTPPDLREHIHVVVRDYGSSIEAEGEHSSGGTLSLADVFTKHRALLLGLGFGWMPLYLVREDLESCKLTEVPFAGETRQVSVPHLVHLTHRPPHRAGQRLHQLLLENYHKCSAQ